MTFRLTRRAALASSAAGAIGGAATALPTIGHAQAANDSADVAAQIVLVGQALDQKQPFFSLMA